MKTKRNYSNLLRLAALLLALMMTLSAVACGGSKAKKNSNADEDGTAASKPIPSLSPEEAAEVVTFEDPTFEAAFRKKYGKTGDITRGELWEMTELDLESYKLQNIDDVAKFGKLTKLHLGLNYISDLRALSGLTDLEDLSLWGNYISDLRALSGLANLKRLSLSKNSISDLSALSGLTSLKALFLGGNSISDINALAGLTKLTVLELGSNNISNISALAGLTNLTELRLSGNTIPADQCEMIKAALPNCEITF